MLRRQPIAFVLLLLLGAIPCLARASFVYVTNYGDGTISQYRANANGLLTPLTPPTVRAHILCHSLAVARGRYLYAASARDWRKRDCVVSQYRIAPNGRLMALTPAQVLVPGTPATIAVEPSGRFAYVFDREGAVAQFRIGTDGRLSPLSPLVIKVADSGGVTPIVGFDKLHRILYGSYVVAFHANVVGGTFSCAIEQDGHLKPFPSSHKNYDTVQQTLNWVSPPYSLSLTPNGRYAYITESLHDNRLPSQWREVVTQCKTRADGMLVALSPGMVKGGGTSFIDPKGHVLYLLSVKMDADDVTEHYRIAYAFIGRNGKLGKFIHQTHNFAAPTTPNQNYSLAFDPTGRFLYFVEGHYLHGDYIYLFRRRADGSLSPLRPPKLSAGYGPLGIVCVQR